MRAHVKKPAVLGLQVLICCFALLSPITSSPSLSQNLELDLKRLQQATDGLTKVSTSRATGVAKFVRLPEEGLTTLSGATPQAKANAFFAEYGGLFGIKDPIKELDLIGVTQGPVLTHVTYHQLHRKVPVFAGVLRVAFDHSDRLLAVHGVFAPDLDLKTTPAWTLESAAEVAVSHLQELGQDEKLHVVEHNLYVFRTGLVRGVPGSSHLVWEIELNDETGAIREFVYVDAHSGEIVDHITGVHEGHAGLHREVSETTLANLVWTEGDPFPTGNAERDEEIVSTGETYNLFSSMTGGAYRSYDGADIHLRSVDNHPGLSGISCPNAWWDGTATNYCATVMSDDLVSHEWSHAYTELTNNLIYQWQSGALNESYSDIWGEVVDLVNGRGTDFPGGLRSGAGCSAFGSGTPSVDNSFRWLIFEDVTGFGGAIRDMWTPNCFSDPGKVTDSEYHCEASDNGGVHTNSGVLNHAFALVVDGGSFNGQSLTGIGLTKAARIYWEAQNLLTPASDFVDQADALDTACSALVGATLYELDTASPDGTVSPQTITATDCTQITRASAAVELRHRCFCGSCESFICTGRPLVAQDFDAVDPDAQLFELNPSPSPFTFGPIGFATGIEINNLGFRKADGMLYGLQLNENGNDQLIQIDANGTVFGLGRPAGLPADVRFDAGDVSEDGSMMFLTAGTVDNSVPLYKVPLPSLTPVTSVQISGPFGNVHDWAYNPADDKLYGGDGANQQIAVLEPQFGTRTDYIVPGFPTGIAFGGAWFGGDGRLFLYRNNGEIYEIDLGDLNAPTPTIVDIHTGLDPVHNEAAACVQNVVGAAKHMSATLGGFPSTITIEYTFENFSDVEDLFDLTAEDDLRTVFGTHGIDWTFNSITSEPVAFANPQFNGDTETELIASAQILPASSTTTVTVEIEVLTPTNLDDNNNFCNQVEVIAATAGGALFGDLSTDGFDPDPNGDGRPHESDLSCVPVGQEPFDCRGETFVMQEDPAQLYEVTLNAGSFAFNPMATTANSEINSMGFRRTDRLLYALQLNPNGNDQIVQIDRNGTVFGLGRPAGLPPDVRFDAGGLSYDGRKMFISAPSQNLYIVDLTAWPLAATSVTITGAAGAVHDWAYNPADGKLYGGDSANGQIAVLDPETGFRNDVTLPGFLPRTIAFGGAWFDVSRKLFLHRNNGEIYEIDLAAPTVALPLQTGPASTHNDATACYFQPPFEGEPLIAEVELQWIDLPETTSEIVLAGTNTDLRLRNNTSDPLFFTVQVGGALDDHRETLELGEFLVAANSEILLTVDLASFNHDIFQLEFSARLVAKASGRLNSGGLLEKVAYSASAFFHTAQGQISLYSDEVYFDTYDSGDFKGQATAARLAAENMGLKILGIGKLGAGLDLTDDDGGPPPDIVPPPQQMSDPTASLKMPQQKICLRYPVGTADSGLGAFFEDYYALNDKVWPYWKSRGAAYQVLKTGTSEVLQQGYASTEDGCFTIEESKLPPGENVDIRFFLDSLLFDRIRVRTRLGNTSASCNNDPFADHSSESEWCQPLAMLGTLSEPLTGSDPKYFDFPGAEEHSVRQALAAFPLYWWHHFDESELDYEYIVSVTPVTKGSFAIYLPAGDSDIEIVAHIGNLYRRKFLVGHEIGHAIAEAYTVAQHNEEVYLFSYTDYAHPNSTTPCPDLSPETSRHGLTSQEYINDAIYEGFAHFVAADSYNSHSEPDGRFRYYKGYAGYPAPINLEGLKPAFPSQPFKSNRYDERVCDLFPDSNTGVELDWMRFFWDLHTDNTSIDPDDEHESLLKILADGFFDESGYIWNTDNGYDLIEEHVCSSGDPDVSKYKNTFLEAAVRGLMGNGVEPEGDPVGCD